MISLAVFAPHIVLNMLSKQPFINLQNSLVNLRHLIIATFFFLFSFSFLLAVASGGVLLCLFKNLHIAESSMVFCQFR